MRLYVGLYRGVVTATAADDPAGRGASRSACREFDENYIAWAAPPVPVGGTTAVVTPLGVRVWFQFEHGDVRRPVVTGVIVG
jgi:Type VI secretion system/phage-baseplate injector OB domain